MALRYPITDGFVWNTQLRPNLTYLARTLPALEAIRRSGAYRSRILCIPTDPSNNLVPRRGSYEYQAYVTPGSVFWAWGFGFSFDNGLFSVQITDGCTDEPIFSEVVNLAAIASITFAGRFLRHINPGMGIQQPFTKPLVIGQPGTLNVEITSLASPSVDLGGNPSQLVLWGASPVPVEEQGTIQ